MIRVISINFQSLFAFQTQPGRGCECADYLQRNPAQRELPDRDDQQGYTGSQIHLIITISHCVPSTSTIVGALKTVT